MKFSLSALVAFLLTPHVFGAFDEHLLVNMPRYWHKSRCDTIPVKKIAKAAAPFAIAANSAYERCAGEYEPIPFPSAEKWLPLPISNPGDLKIGFYGKAWIRATNGKKQLVISFRGTQFTECADWTRGNLTTFRFLPCRTQYQAALEYSRSLVASHPNLPVIFTGHSLGGGLAEYCQRFIKNSKAMVFHPSPNKGGLFGMGLPKCEPQVLRVFERGEILALPRWLVSGFAVVAQSGEIDGTKARWINFRKGNALLQHSMNHFAIDLIRLAAVDGDSNAKTVLNQITDSREGKRNKPVHRWWNLAKP